MSIEHQGFVVECDAYHSKDDPAYSSFIAGSARTERTAIERARADGWFIGRVRITSGGVGGRRVVLCPICAWIVGREVRS